MKKSIPTEMFPATASGHWSQTSFGNDGWPSSRIAPLPVEACTGPNSEGVVSTNCETPLRPSPVVAETSSLYELDGTRPEMVTWCEVPAAVAGLHTTGTSRP